MLIKRDIDSSLWGICQIGLHTPKHSLEASHLVVVWFDFSLEDIWSPLPGELACYELCPEKLTQSRFGETF